MKVTTQDLLCKCGTLLNVHGACPRPGCKLHQATRASLIGSFVFFKSDNMVDWEPVMPTDVPQDISRNDGYMGMLSQGLTIHLPGDDVVYRADKLEE